MQPPLEGDDLQRLRLENADLRLRAEVHENDNALLLRLMADVVSSLDLERLLHHIIDHVVAVAGCHGGFIYLADRHRLLTLRAATTPYRHVVGHISMAFGDGLVGWAAETGRPLVLRERAMDDPRFRYFPELDEESFQAMLVIPLLGHDGSTVAVISMHTIAPQEFSDEQVRLVEALAPILGAAIRASELVESARRRLDLLSVISRQVQAVRGGRYLDDSLQALAHTMLSTMASDTCLLIVSEPGLDDLVVRSYMLVRERCTFSRATLPRRPWRTLSATLAPADPGRSLVLPLPGNPVVGGASIVVPLVVAGEQLGLLICYRGAAQLYDDAERTLLTVVAGQLAAAVRNSQLAALLAERDLPARLFRALIEGIEEDTSILSRRAALLGGDLARPHLPVIIELAAPASNRSNSLAGQRESLLASLGATASRILTERYPGSLTHSSSAIYSLVRLSDTIHEATTLEALAGICDLLTAEFGVVLMLGSGSPRSAPREYSAGFAEASEAIRVGRVLGRHGVISFNALGADRYLSLLASGDPQTSPQDRYQRGVERLAAHDASRGTDLRLTLGAYLEKGGNLKRTADQLYIHRNTLDQRLEKARELLGFDPRDSAHWLALHMALALYNLNHP